MDSRNGLQQEWLLLQQQTEALEKEAVLVKLVSLTWVVLAVISAQSTAIKLLLFAVLLLALAWGLEVLLRTQQQRLVQRLLLLEAALRGDGGCMPMQLNSNWQSERGGSKQLLGEYGAQCWRPSVIFPYLPLLMALPFLLT